MTFWVAGAAIVAAGIGYAASDNASSKQSDALASDRALQKYQYDQTREDNMPALESRNSALTRLQELLGIGGNAGAKGYGSLAGPISVGDVTKDPGYQFGMQQGMQSLNNQLTARGMRNSGAALMAASRYGTDYATTKYDDAFNRQLQNRNQQLNPLYSMGNLAQIGTSQIGQAGQNYANNMSQNYQALGNVQAANSLAGYGALSNGVNQLAGWYAYQNRNNNNGYTAGGSAASNAPDNIDAGGGWSPSDIRLKNNIVLIGKTARGFNAYSWMWKHNGQPSQGVIAQEVAAVDPSAVKVGGNGFLMVDYTKV